MSWRPNRIRCVAAVLGVTALATSISGCGGKKDKAEASAVPAVTMTPSAAPTPSGSPEPTPLPAVTADPALAAMVPSLIRKAGTLNVGTDSTYAPSEFLAADGKTVQGFDIDLLDAVAAKLGLKTNYVSAPFDNIIPGVQSGKYDFAVSAFTINAEREKVVEMVSYFSAGVQWAVRAGGNALNSVDDACGKKIAVQTGTTEATELVDKSKACQKAGKPEITIDQFQGQDQATAAVVSGKDDAMSADSPVTAYAVQQTGGKLATLGPSYGTAPYGYVLKKGQTEFAKAVAKALNELIADGAYKRILDHWGVAGGAIPVAQVDPTPVAASPSS